MIAPRNDSFTQPSRPTFVAMTTMNFTSSALETSTKILATLGPGSSDKSTIEDLYAAGVNVFRLNFSHGSHENHAQTIANIRQLEQERGTPIAIMADLQGPKFRIGTLPSDVVLQVGQTFKFHLREVPGTKDQVQLPHKSLFAAAQADNHLLIDDGKLVVRVTRVEPQVLTTEVIIGGPISSNKGVAIPDTRIPVNALTDKDKKDLHFALANDIRIFALSFVQKTEDLLYLREQAGTAIRIVAKLEKPAALEDLAGIVDEADAIMIARGDLGVELSPGAVPVAQKKIISQCRTQGKPVIVATQMLESMTHMPTPTRAEASDVANAVYSRVDAVMLSGETAVGKYPVATVRMMKDIIAQVEQDLKSKPVADEPLGEHSSATANNDKQISQAIGHAVRELADTLASSAIASFTTSGSTAITIAGQRPAAPLAALTADAHTARFMAFLWGTRSLVTEDASNFDDMVSIVRSTLLQHGICKTDDRVIITAGVPFGSPGKTNIVRVETL